MPIVRVQVDADGKQDSNIHLGQVAPEEYQKIKSEIMDIIYRRQKKRDFSTDTARRLLNDPDTSPEVLRQWLRAALGVIR